MVRCIASLPLTRFRREFHRTLARVAHGETIIVTRCGEPELVILPPAVFKRTQAELLKHLATAQGPKDEP